MSDLNQDNMNTNEIIRKKIKLYNEMPQDAIIYNLKHDLLTINRNVL